MHACTLCAPTGLGLLHAPPHPEWAGLKSTAVQMAVSLADKFIVRNASKDELDVAIRLGVGLHGPNIIIYSVKIKLAHYSITLFFNIYPIIQKKITYYS
jgi:hypothetical protein